MKCQECDQLATCHISEIVEKHLCDVHAEKLLGGKPPPIDKDTVFAKFWDDAAISMAMRDPAGRQQFLAHLLPVLCLALLDKNPAVRVRTAFRLMLLGRDAQSTVGALRDALGDPEQHVRKAAQLALQHISTNPDPIDLF
jgi:hypothetical protein